MLYIFKKIVIYFCPRYGTFESFGFGTLSAEDAVTDYENSYRGYGDSYSDTWAADWDRPCLVASQRSRSPVSDSSRESQYSTSNLSDSSSLYSPSHSRPAPIGTRGRDMHTYMQRNYCGRGAVVSEDRQKAVEVSLDLLDFNVYCKQTNYLHNNGSF